MGLLLAGTLLGCEPVTVDVTLQRLAGDRAAIATTPTETVVTIHSERGVGRATITPVGATWPEQLILRLHLRNLEGIDLSNGLWRLNSFLGADLAVPYAPVGRAGGPRYDGSDPTVNLPITRDGEMIEVVVPELFLDDAYPELYIQWVDYYRE